MNRLGTALTPVDLAPVSRAPPRAEPGAQSGDLRQTGRASSGDRLPAPRVRERRGASFVAARSHSMSSRTSSFRPTTATSWTPIANSDHYATLYPGSTPAQHVSLAPFGWVDLAVGQTVRFGVGLARFAGTGTSVTAGCSLAVQIGIATPDRPRSIRSRRHAASAAHPTTTAPRRRRFRLCDPDRYGRIARHVDRSAPADPIRVACVLGTRPEVVKMAPVIHALARLRAFRADAGQHRPASRAALPRRWRCSTCVPTSRST